MAVLRVARRHRVPRPRRTRVPAVHGSRHRNLTDAWRRGAPGCDRLCGTGRAHERRFQARRPGGRADARRPLRHVVVVAILDPKAAIAYCENHKDFVSRKIFDGILKSEEDHVDWLETQLGLIDKMGLENYLLGQT